MKKKLASVLYNMNYELATYSYASQLVESPALTLIVGVAKRAQLRARASSMRYSLPITQSSVSRRLKVYHILYIAIYDCHIANALLLC